MEQNGMELEGQGRETEDITTASALLKKLVSGCVCVCVHAGLQCEMFSIIESCNKKCLKVTIIEDYTYVQVKVKGTAI